jgi:hypothetical protein
LNKIDILKRKLDAGVRVRDHLSEYGDRKNDFQTVSTCRFISRLLTSQLIWRLGFRKNFAKIYKEVSPSGRTLTAHFTSVVVRHFVELKSHYLSDCSDEQDTKVTAQTLAAGMSISVAEMITQ